MAQGDFSFQAGTIKYKSISVTTTGNNTLVAAVTDKKIRVVSLFIFNTTAQSVAFESGADGTALSGDMPLGSLGKIVLPFNPGGWFETAAGVLLNLEISGSTLVTGSLSYIEVT